MTDCVKENPDRRVTFFFLDQMIMLLFNSLPLVWQQALKQAAAKFPSPTTGVIVVDNDDDRNIGENLREKNVHFRDGGPVVIMGT